MRHLLFPLLVALSCSAAAYAQSNPLPGPSPVPAPTASPTPTPDLNGAWRDNARPVTLKQTGTTVTATYDADYDCDPRDGGAIQKTRDDFKDATLSGNQLQGQTTVCLYGKGNPHGTGLKKAAFKLRLSKDGNSLDGSFFNSNTGKDVSFTITRTCSADTTPTIEITLPDTLNIDTFPQMPNINATVKVTPAGAPISWTAKITYKAPGAVCSGGPDFDSAEVTGAGTTFTPNFGSIYGGKLTITAKTTCGKGASTNITRTIGGVSPSKADVQAALGSLAAPFDSGDLKRIACQESHQEQFKSNNSPNLGGGGDAGIMQICYLRTAGDVWNWKTNVSTAHANLLGMSAFSRSIPGKVRTQVVRGMGPFPKATDFTPEQLRLEAIKRYNAGLGADVGYWEWDDAAGQWVANPQGGGDPDYVTNVLGKDPTCP